MSDALLYHWTAEPRFRRQEAVDIHASYTSSLLLFFCAIAMYNISKADKRSDVNTLQPK